MKKKWKRFIKDNDHYCPYCSPEDPYRESVILTSTLKDFLECQEQEKQNKIQNLLDAGYKWTMPLLSKDIAENAMLSWDIQDWIIVAKGFAPDIKVTTDQIIKVQILLRKEKATDNDS